MTLPASDVKSKVTSDFCRNCGIRLTGQFCAICGQKAADLAFRDFLHELAEEMFSVDGRIVQSIRRLLLSPGFLTAEYLQGRRARWVSPIRLYLFFSVMFFGLSAITGFRGTEVSERRPSGWSFSWGNSPHVSSTTRNDEDEDIVARRLGFENAAVLKEAVNRALLAWVPRVMFVMLPLFAWLVALAYRRIDRNYLHHLIFAVHVHAAWFAAGAAAIAIELALPSIGYVLQQFVPIFAVVYLVLAFRRAYGRVRFSFARVVFVLVTYAAAFIAVFAAIVMPIFIPYWFPGPT